MPEMSKVEAEPKLGNFNGTGACGCYQYDDARAAHEDDFSKSFDVPKPTGTGARGDYEVEATLGAGGEGPTHNGTGATGGAG